MTSITALKVINKLNEQENEEFEIYTKWSDTKIQVLIIKHDKTVLGGEAIPEDFKKFSKTFDKSFEAYLQEIKDILTGENTNVEFYLKNNCFYWKEKRLALGQFDVGPIQNPNYIAEFMWHLLNDHSNLKKNLLDSKKSNKDLKNENFLLKKKLCEMTKLKDEIETELYRKFILVINSKKAKIRELKSIIKKNLSDEDPIFSAITDESENETESNEDDLEKIEKKCESEMDEKTKSVSNDQVVKTDNVNNVIMDESSTSGNVINEDEETPDLLTYESECELELKLEEEKFENVNKSKQSTMTEEESEEEMF